MTFLFTALAIHLFHRPWWNYYYLHLAIPMAWLAGHATSIAISKASELFRKSQFDWFSQLTWKGIGLCGLVAVALVRSESRLEGGVSTLRESETVASSPVLAAMRKNAAQTHWMYVQFGSEEYPFHLQLPMPPELAVVTLKRFWSNQISTKEIVGLCRHYRPEQILLKLEPSNTEWKEFLIDYNLAYQNSSYNLYVLNSKN